MNNRRTVYCVVLAWSLVNNDRIVLRCPECLVNNHRTMYHVNLGRLMDNHRTMYRVVLAWHLVNNYRKLYYVQGVCRIITENCTMSWTSGE